MQSIFSAKFSKPHSCRHHIQTLDHDPAVKTKAYLGACQPFVHSTQVPVHGQGACTESHALNCALSGKPLGRITWQAKANACSSDTSWPWWQVARLCAHLSAELYSALGPGRAHISPTVRRNTSSIKQLRPNEATLYSGGAIHDRPLCAH